MSLLKFILYSLIAFLVIRFVMRLISPQRPNQSRPNQTQSSNSQRKGAQSLDELKFTIEAESVDYEIIEEPKKKNEE